MEKKTDSADEDASVITAALETALKHNRFGGMLFAAGKLDTALEHFEKAEKILADLGIPYTNTIVNQANVYAQLKDYTKALERYEHAISISPHNLSD